MNLIKDFNIPELEEKNYWFVRTDSGKFFHDFTLNSYISIGWDYLTVEKMGKDEAGSIKTENLKNLISVMESRPIDLPEGDSEDDDENDKKKLESEIISNRREVTKVLNKVSSFIYDIKINDIVIIPSQNSDKIAIGKIISDIYIDTNYVDNFLQKMPLPEYPPCTFQKRRKVQWYKTISKDKLDIYLQNALKPQQAISSLNEYAEFVDRNIHDIYIKEGRLHSIIHTYQEENISLTQLKQFIDFVYDYTLKLCESDETQIHPDEIKVKLNIHSPGIIEVIYAGTAVIVAGALFFMCYSIHKNGGKVGFKTKNGTEFLAETNGIAGNDIENKKIELVEKCINDPEFSKKIEALSSLNLSLPEVYVRSNDEK